MPRGQFDRTPRKERTRARLLEAAGRVFGRRGLALATLDEVADEAGYTKGAVYAHFGSKESLMLALFEEHLAEQLAELGELFDEAGEPSLAGTERARVGAARWMARLATHPDDFRLFMELWSHAQRDPELRPRFAAHMSTAHAAFAEFARRTAAEVDMPASPAVAGEVATTMLALSNGISMIKLAHPDGVPDSLLGAALTAIVDALALSPQSRELFERAAREAGAADPRRGAA